MTKQGTAIGLFITLEDPTSEMIREVKAIDPYISPNWNHEYPWIQILTISQLITGERFDIPPTNTVFKEAPRVEREKGLKQK